MGVIRRIRQVKTYRLGLYAEYYRIIVVSYTSSIIVCLK